MKLMSVRWTCLFLLLVGLAAMTNVVSAEQGRWKVDGDGNCYFDANDDGPDQCTPPGPPTGRWKFAGDGTCYFEANDSGPNQCEPPVTEPTTAPLEDFLGSLSASTAVPRATLPEPALQH